VAAPLALALYAVFLVAVGVAVWRRPVRALYLFVVGLAVHNAVGAALYGAGVHGAALTAIEAWKEILLGVALLRVVRDALRARRLPFEPRAPDALALAFALVVVVYGIVPQSALGGHAGHKAVLLGLKHDLIPVGAYFLGRSLLLGRTELRRLGWTIAAAAAIVAAFGLVEVYAVPISSWRSSSVPDYFNKQLGYDYHGTGRLPENFVYNTGSESHFLRRLVSVFLSPLATSYMLVVALLLSVALNGRRRLLAVLAVVSFAGLLWTFSRASVAALVVGLCLLALVRRRAWPLAAAVAAAAIGVGFAHVFTSIAPEGHWTKADLEFQRERAKQHPGASGQALSLNESSIHSHWENLKQGLRTDFHHPQGYGVGNVGQTASRTGVPLKAGESNYTEIAAETGLVGGVLWIAWGLALLAAIVVAARRGSVFAAVLAAAFAAILALAIQTDVIGDPWVAYCVWALAGSLVAVRRTALPEGSRTRVPVAVASGS
jgi:O-Antigen ligase